MQSTREDSIIKTRLSNLSFHPRNLSNLQRSSVANVHDWSRWWPAPFYRPSPGTKLDLPVALPDIKNTLNMHHDYCPQCLCVINIKVFFVCGISCPYLYVTIVTILTQFISTRLDSTRLGSTRRVDMKTVDESTERKKRSKRVKKANLDFGV